MVDACNSRFNRFRKLVVRYEKLLTGYIAYPAWLRPLSAGGKLVFVTDVVTGFTLRLHRLLEACATKN